MRRSIAVVFAAVATAAVAGSCADDSAGPGAARIGRMSVVPSFGSLRADVIDYARARFLVTRIPGGEIARDTVINLGAGADSVSLDLTVRILSPGEVFNLTVSLISTTGDTAFVAGPVQVTPSSEGPPISVDLVFEYVGIGADAADLQVTTPDTATYTSEAILLSAVALDSNEAAIANTPIGWESLDSTIVRITGRDAQYRGTAVGGAARGTARIVATLPTGQQDTVLVGNQPQPAAFVAESGNNQSARADSLLPQPLVVRATGGDGQGVSGLWVRFSVVAGGGLLSADSVMTGADGRAAVQYTMARFFQPHTITGTTSRWSGAPATFTATLQVEAAASIEIAAGDGQTAAAGSAVAIDPQVLVLDAEGLPVPGVMVTFSVTGGGGGVTGPTPMTDLQGLAAVGSWVMGNTAGPNALQATVNALQVSFSADGIAGPATQIAIVTGNGQADTVGATLPQPLVVLASDGLGNPVEGATVDWVTATGGLSAPSTLSDENGNAQVTWTLGTATVPHSVTATLRGTPSTVPFTAVVSAGNAARLLFTAEPSDVLQGTAMVPAIQVTAVDGFDNIATGFTGAVQLDILDNPGDASIGGTTSVAATAGAAGFNDITLSATGSGYTLLATAAGLESDTSAAFDVFAAGNAVWNNPAGGDWHTPGNWLSGAVPGPSDTAIITLDGTYTVTLANPATVAALIVGGVSGIQTLSHSAGVLTVTETALFSPTGSYILNGTIASGVFTVAGPSAWNGGTIGAGVQFTNQGLMTLGGGAKTLDPGARLNNQGTILHGGTSSLVLEVGAVVTNEVGALYDFQGDASIDWATGTSPEPSVINSGTILKSGGAGLTFIDQLSNFNGTIEVQTGELELRHFTGTTNVSTGGVFNVSPGATLDLTPELGGYDDARFVGTYTGTGGGSVRFDNGTLNAGIGASFNFPAPMFQWQGGTIIGPFTNVNAMTWSGGTLAAGGDILNAGTLTITGAGAKTLGASADLVSTGVVVHGGTGSVVLSVGSVLRVETGALYEMAGDVDIDWVSGTSPEPFVINLGTIRKSAGTGQSFIDQLLNAGGTLEVQTGELELRSFDGTTNVSTGGVFTVAPGAVLDLTSEQATHDDGTYEGSYTGAGGGTVLFDNGLLSLGTGATFNLPGAMFQWQAGTFVGGPLTNAGTLTAVGAGAKAFGAGTIFTNTGTLVLETGTVSVAGAFTHAAGAILQGGGFLDLLNAVSAVLDGAVVPGLSPGQLTIAGLPGLTMGGSGGLNIELAGNSTPGGDYDNLQVTNSLLTLGGALNVVLVPPYVPSGGETWVVASGITGGFAVANLPPTLDTLTSNDTLFVVSTAPPGLRVAGWGVERSPLFSLSGGGGMQEARASLTAAFPDASLVGIDVLTTPALVDVDVLVLSSLMSNVAGIAPLSVAEQGALLGFIAGGGCAVVMTDNNSVAAANASLLDAFGMAADGLLAGQVTATVTNPASTPITQGPFGTVTTFTQNVAGFFSSLGPAASLATNASGSALAVIPSNALGAGSGPVILFSDPNTFADAEDAGLFAANEALWRNLISACQGPITGPGSGMNHWTNPAGGDWSDPGNWSLGRVPVATDTVFIALDGTYTVLVDDVDPTVDFLFVGAGSGEQTLRLQQRQITATVGVNVNVGGRLFLANGSIFGSVTVAGSLRIEGATGVNGVLGLMPGSTAIIQGNNNFTHATLSVGEGFSNQGVIDLENGSVGSNWTAGINVGGGPFVNLGTVNARAGIGGGDRVITGEVQNFGTIATPSDSMTITGSLSHLSGAVLEGNYPISLPGVFIGVFEGEVHPGNATTGILTLLQTGLAMGSGAILEIHLNGDATPGVDFDQLRSEGGLVTLGGSLEIALMGGFVPDGSETWPIVAGATGSFATILPPAGFAADTATVNDTLYLTVTPSQQANAVNWTGAVDNNWSTPGNWDTGVLPQPGDSVVIDLAGNYLVNLDVAADVGWLIVGDAGDATLGFLSGIQLTITTLGHFGPRSAIILRGTAVMNGSGELVFEGLFNWQGGTLQGSGSTRILGTATTGGALFLDARTLVVSGHLTIDGALGTLTAIGSPLILVEAGGTLVLANGADLFAGAGAPTLENQGTLVINGTDDEAVVDWAVNNLGIIDVTSFVLDVRGLLTHQVGGLISVADNAELVSHGHSDIHGPVTVSPLGRLTLTGGALDATHLLFPTSTVQSTGTVTVDAAALVQVTGAFETTTLNLQNSTLRFDGADTAFVSNLSYTGGGFLSGTGVLAIRSTATTLAGNIDGNGHLAILTGASATLQSPLRGWTIDVAGVLNWGDFDLSLLPDPVTLQNATINILAGGVMEIQHAGVQRTLNGTAANPITNAGIIRKSAGTALTLFLPPVTNTGVIDVQTGTVQTRGLNHQAGATIFGHGTLDLGPGTTTLAGAFSPGASPGILTLLGVAPVYDPTTSGVLDIEINGPTLGTQYDRLAVTGAAALNGTLNVTVNSFTPTTADTMVILTSTALSGTFATTNLPGSVTLVYDTPQNRVILVGTAPAGLGMAFVADVGSSDLNAVDLTTDSTATTVGCALVAQCFEPRNLDVNPAGTRVAVPFRFSDVVLFFEPGTGAYVDFVDDASFVEPYAVAFTPDGTELWVANKFQGGSDTGTVSVVDVAQGSVVAVIEDESISSPEGIAIAGGRAWVPNRGRGSVTIIDVTTRVVLDSLVDPLFNEPRYAIGTPDGAWVYVSTNTNRVIKVNTTTLARTEITLPVGGSRNMAVHPDGSRIFIAQQNGGIAVVDVATDQVRSIGFTGAGSTYGVAIARDGLTGFVTDESTGQVFVFDPVTETQVTNTRFPITGFNTPRAIVAH